MGKLDQEVFDEFNASRTGVNKEYVCNAPFSNMYFSLGAIGRVAPCWLTFADAPSWPEHSIRQIWFGAFYSRLRKFIKKRDLTGHPACQVCEKNIRTRNFIGTLASNYDLEHPLQEYPTMMELELSNECNLECIMCRGELSSSIRKNRDKLPPLITPYDQRFVEQLVEFIPHLREMRVNGGEPFLQDICFEIWNKVAEINPEIEITVATNGTILNKRVKDILERCNFRINVSIDALDKENYQRIRKNARYDVLMRNVRYFGDYCRGRRSVFSVMINPMRQNWWEMPEMVEWCNASGYHLAYNTVVKPNSCSLITWDAEHLEEVYRTLSARKFEFDPASEIPSGNVKKYENLVENQIRQWWIAQKQGQKFYRPAYMDD
jgi:molybdenum cofactor biosynthesis enzyme MoaA